MVMHTANNSICPSTDKADYCVDNKAWMKITGPAAQPLADVFFGLSAVVQPEITAAGEGEKKVKAQGHSVNVGVYNALRPTPQGQGAEGVKPQAASKIIVKGTDGAQKCIKVLRAYRIILLGETGAGKSTLGNSIFGEDVFKPGKTSEYQIQSKSVHERRITLLDTPGFSYAEGELKDELARCTRRCTPGPHVFLIVLKVEKSLQQQLAVIHKICQCFSEEAFKYAAVVFTHSDQLASGIQIEQYIDQNPSLKDLIMKCSNRYLVIDCKNDQWGDKTKFQMSQLFNTIDKIVTGHRGGCYTNTMLQARKTNKDNTKSGDSTQSNDNRGNTNACNSVWINFSGPEGKLVTEALFGSAVAISPRGPVIPKTKAKEESKTDKDKVPDRDSKAEKEEAPNNEESVADPGKAVEESEMPKKTVKQGRGGGSDGNKFFTVLGAALAGIGAVIASLWLGLSATAGVIAWTGAVIASSVLGSLVPAGVTVLAGVLRGVAIAVDAIIVTALGLVAAAVAWVVAKIKKIICLLIHLREIIKENIGIVILVVAFYFLLLLTFLSRVLMVGTLLLSCGILVMFLIIMLLLITIM
ncbi:uncharacterized protein LOC105917684 [Fundulus heteroclitus]|uniref:uncharacterized protein LOC105917684 n=1 Tax=Fundulus heteroclitus TaxID=8078 RepID=UPI00165B12E8|nr:uncharacterized protein LOC105917684 [Fundulus heteroclitus]